MPYNTGNPIPSSDAKDLSDNAENLDNSVNTALDTWTDRLGVERRTIQGQLKLLGYTSPDVYTGGLVFTVADNMATIERNKIIYAPLPSAIPFTTSGTWTADDENKFFVAQGLTTSSDEIVLAADTVADMKTKDLQSGQIIRTKGYYAKGDAGGASYLIQTAGEFGGTPDGFGDHVLDSGNVAVLQNKERVNIMQFGAAGNGITDDTAQINAALAYDNVYAPSGIYNHADLTKDATTSTVFTFSGDGAVFNSSTTTLTVAALIINGNTNLEVNISGVEFIGNYIDASGVINGIQIDTCNEFNIDNIDVRDFQHTGLLIENTETRGSLTNSILDRNGYANTNLFGRNLLAQNVTSTNAGRPSLGVVQGYGIIINGFRVTVCDSDCMNNSRYNIDCRNSSHALIEGNTLVGAGFYNLHAVNESAVKSFNNGCFINNFIDGANVSAGAIRTGVYGTGSTVNVSKIEFSGNTIKRMNNTGVAGYGILVNVDNSFAPDLVVINNNFFEDNIFNTSLGGAAIRIQNNAAGSSIGKAYFNENTIVESSIISSAGVDVVECHSNIIESSVTAVETSGIILSKNSGTADFADVKDNKLVSTNGSFSNPIQINNTTNFDAPVNYLNGVNIDPQSTNEGKTIEVSTSKIFNSDNFEKYQGSVVIASSGGSESIGSFSSLGSIAAVKVFWSAFTGFSSNRASESGFFVLTTHNESGTFELPGASPYTIPQATNSKATSTHTIDTNFVATVLGSALDLSTTATTNSGRSITVNYVLEFIPTNSVFKQV